jgi:hypothetical protein
MLVQVSKSLGLYAWRVEVDESASWELHEKWKQWLAEYFSTSEYFVAAINVVYFKTRENAMFFSLTWN